eukprot:g3453.t1
MKPNGTFAISFIKNIFETKLVGICQEFVSLYPESCKNIEQICISSFAMSMMNLNACHSEKDRAPYSSATPPLRKKQKVQSTADLSLSWKDTVFTYATNAYQSRVKCKEWKLSGQIAHKLTGTFPHTSYAPGNFWILSDNLKTYTFKGLDDEKESLKGHDARVQDQEEKESSWISLGTYLAHFFTKKCTNRISFSEAAWWGMVDVRNPKNWCHTFFGLPDTLGSKLPQISGHVQNDLTVHPEILNACGFLTGFEKTPNRQPKIDVSLGISDGLCANVGSGCIGTTRIAVTIGTSAAIRILIKKELLFGEREGKAASEGIPYGVPAGLWCYTVTPHYVLLGGALTDGGSIIQWLTDNFSPPLPRDTPASTSTSTSASTSTNTSASTSTNTSASTSAPVLGAQYSMFEKEASRIFVENEEVKSTRSPVTAYLECEKVHVLPFLSPERSPNYQSDVSLTLTGITKETRRGALYYACMESIVFRLYSLFKRLKGFIDLEKATIVCSGGALRSNLRWQQILADMFRLPVVKVVGIPDVTSFGATLFVSALKDAKGDVDLQNVKDYPWEYTAPIEPTDDKSICDYFRRKFEAHETLYERFYNTGKN